MSFKSKYINKRDFIKYSLLGLGAIILKPKIPSLFALEKKPALPNKLLKEPPPVWKWSRETYYYSQTARGVKCEMCPSYCQIKPGDKGLCRSRINENNKLYSIAYGNPCTVNIDPVEKKPLYHYLPQAKAYSIATAGCTFACMNCQNWEISQISPDESQNFDMFPSKVVDNAVAGKCRTIAYTYAEPLSFYEYTFETSKIARQKGLRNLLISNGYINEKPLRELCKYIDAANINIKGFDENTYQKLNGGSLQPVLDSLKIMKEMGVWIEITNLVVPTWTDDLNKIKKMCDWLAVNGFTKFVMHFLRFFPMYKLQHLESTPVDVLEKARDIAMKAGMKYVYIGNVPGHYASNTYCAKCRKLIIERTGFIVTANNIVNGKCKFCGEIIPGVWA